LRNIEKNIAALEQIRGSSIDVNLTPVSAVPAPENLPGADWIHRKARELELRLRGVEQTFKHENGSGSNRSTNVSTNCRAVTRYSKTNNEADPKMTMRAVISCSFATRLIVSIVVLPKT